MLGPSPPSCPQGCPPACPSCTGQLGSAPSVEALSLSGLEPWAGVSALVFLALACTVGLAGDRESQSASLPVSPEKPLPHGKTRPSGPAPTVLSDLCFPAHPPHSLLRPLASGVSLQPLFP